MSKSKRKKKKQTGTAKKVFIILLCLVVLAALGLSIAGNVILHQKISDYTDSLEPPFDGGNVVVTPIDPAPGISLLSIDSSEWLVSNEETADFLVTVTPDVDATVLIDWSIAFTNPESDWARGKYVTEYATVVPTRNGALTANISVKQAFAEQITVKAAVRNDKDVYVTCTVDYVCKYTMQGFEIEKVDNSYNESSAKITPILSKSIGTLDEELTSTITLGMNDNFKNFYADVVAPVVLSQTNSTTSYLENYFNNFKEIGNNGELITNLYGYIGPNAITTQKAFGYLDLDSDRYKIHMERFFGYMLPRCLPANPDFQVLLQSIVKYERYSKDYISTDTANAINNGINTLLPKIPTSNSYGFSEAQGTSGAHSGFYVISDAFYIQYECHTTYNNITYKENFAFVFKEIPGVVGNLTIDPPSIIV